MNELALFAGAGGGILGGKLLGWKTVCAVECDAYAAQVLAQRQNDGCFEPFPIWSDVCSFDGKPWRGHVDVVSGGFPCQDISAAGKGAGIDGERSGLWGEMARIICEVRPRYAFVENSPMLTSRGLGTVLGDLAELGYDAKWCVLGADDVGAPHRRKRIWIVADAKSTGTRKDKPGLRNRTCGTGRAEKRKSETVADAKKMRLQGSVHHKGTDAQGRQEPDGSIAERRCTLWKRDPANEGTTESSVGRVVDGLAYRTDRLKAIGNGQVPLVAATAWRILTL